MTDMQAAIMHALGGVTGLGGYQVADIAFFVGRQPGRDSNRQHSALIQSELRALEKAGLVRRLDNERPTVWCMVA